ncbi:MAG TPA: STAS domain-containing protein [Albitalea sp.]
MKQDNTAIDELLSAQQQQILQDWLAEVTATGRSTGSSAGVTSQGEALEMLKAFHDGVRADGDAARFDDAAWARLRAALEDLSKSRAAKGSSAGETNHFVLSLKKPLFAGLQQRLAGEPGRLVGLVWTVSTLVDAMAQFTVNTYQRSREEVILRQQQELLELSTPVVKLWDGVLAVPMIGTLDSARTQLVMESLLQRIVETGSELAIIDITGVPTVDTLVAQHLLKTVTAIRLMGADCIISGVRPQIAQTIVHLGIDLQGITTKSSLADALALALRKVGYTVTRTKA